MIEDVHLIGPELELTHPLDRDRLARLAEALREYALIRDPSAAIEDAREAQECKRDRVFCEFAESVRGANEPRAEAFIAGELRALLLCIDRAQYTSRHGAILAGLLKLADWRESVLTLEQQARGLIIGMTRGALEQPPRPV